jgi:hypothetical protein
MKLVSRFPFLLRKPENRETGKQWTLTLNKYQRDNLLWLINACGWPYFYTKDNAVEPFTLANTGDWIGEIGWMLADPDMTPKVEPFIREGDRPNVSFDELRQRVAAWRVRRDSSS